MQRLHHGKGRFLDVTIAHPGSTYDFLGFTPISLYTKLKRKGLLAPRLFICADNACVANEHVQTPFENVSLGSEHAYDLCQSQLKI